jgi:hypothetical protein
MQSVWSDILHSPPAVAAILAAIVALVIGVLGPLVQLRIGKRQTEAAQSREIARMRLAWMEKLRDIVSEYHSILMIKKNVDQENLAQKLSLLGTQIDLMLNQNDKVQKVLWDVTDKIYKTQSRAKRQSMDKELVDAGRAVLKSEWEKVKAEMRGEPFKTGE